MIYVIYLIKGIILGCTIIIPGVSIGTMALVLDVFDSAVINFTILVTPKKWNKEIIYKLFEFFFPILVGLGIGMIALANAFSWLLEYHPSFLQLSFVGLIIGSLPHIYKAHVKQYMSIKMLPFILLGMAIIVFFALSHKLVDKNAVDPATIVLSFSTKTALLAFGIGVLGAFCGLIPGISGSFIILVIGHYPFMLAIIKNLYFPLFIPWIIGSVIALIGTSFLVKFFLLKFPAQSYSVILGMILASGMVIFPTHTLLSELHTNFAGILTFNVLVNSIIALLCLGLGIVLAKISTNLNTKKAP